MLLSRVVRLTPATCGLATLAVLLTLVGPAAAQQLPVPPPNSPGYLPPDTKGTPIVWAMLAYAQQRAGGTTTPLFVDQITRRNYSTYIMRVVVPPGPTLPPTDSTYAYHQLPVELKTPAPLAPPTDRTYTAYTPPATDRNYAYYAPPAPSSNVSQYDANYAWYTSPNNVTAPAPVEQQEPRYVSIVGPDGRTRTFRLEGTVITGQAAPVYVRARR